MSPPSSAFRFAPSPNGRLHLGHARSALLNLGMARVSGGRFLIRIEDIDRARCTPGFETAALSDLDRLGVVSDGPIRRQSDHFADYAGALARFREMGLVYPAFLSRADIKQRVAALEAGGHPWPRDPDGAPLYPGTERSLAPDIAASWIASGEQVIWRLDMERASARVGQLHWKESGGEDPENETDLLALQGVRRFRTIDAEPQRWGDVILARADVPTSYHLSVVVDDAAQGVTDVVRGADLYQATSVHRLMQELLELPAPRYHHHRLVRDRSGRKLAKSDGDVGVATLLDRGVTPEAILSLSGLLPAVSSG